MAANLRFFDMFRSYLKIERNISSKFPKNFKEIYSGELGKMFKGTSWNEFELNGDERRQIITFNISHDYKIVVKRKSNYCNIVESNQDEEDKKILNDPDIQNFLNEGLKEYFMSRMISAYPSGLSCFDFKITKLSNINTLVYEFMMEYGGDTLEEYILYKKPKNFDGFRFFKELINTMKFIEKLRMAYSDVKLGNFLVDSNGNLRITDYDASQMAGFFDTFPNTGVTRILGTTKGYTAPEVLEFIRKFGQELNINNNGIKDKIDPWKADVYSCGIVGLILFGVILTPKTLGVLDCFKKNEEEHRREITDMAKVIPCPDPILKEKLEYVIGLCLEFYPDKRPNFNQLNKIFENIENGKEKINEFKEKMNRMFEEEKIKQNNKTYIDKLKEENIQLEESLKIKDKENKIIIEEITKLKENMRNQQNEKEKITQQLIDIREKYVKLMEESNRIIFLLQKDTGISIGLQNIDSFIQEVTSNFQAIKNEKEQYQEKIRIVLEDCKSLCIQFNEELLNDINDIPQFMRKILNNQNIPKKIIPNKMKILPGDKKSKKIETKKDVKNVITKIQKEDKKEEKKEEKKLIKSKNFEDAFNQLVNGKKIRPEIAKMINSNGEWWHMEKEDNEPTKKEILNIFELVKLSEKIEKLTYTDNPNFDLECEKAYLEAIKASNSIMTIILYKTNVSKEVTLEMLKMLEIKPKIKVLVVEKSKIEEKVAHEFAKKIKLDINNWNSKYWNYPILTMIIMLLIMIIIGIQTIKRLFPSELYSNILLFFLQN